MEEARYEIKKDIFNGHFTLPKTDTLKYTDYSGTKFTIIIMKE
jgi:hypothetical protein